jgi:predicted amidohydrolase
MTHFAVAAAQVASYREEIELNLEIHAAAAQAAAAQGVTVLVFPELSLTGYEPDLAEALAIEPTDERLRALGSIAMLNQMTIIVGAPLMSPETRPLLGSITFHPDGRRTTYAKMHLGSEEAAFFVPGTQPSVIDTGGQKIGLSICADSSQESHPAWYHEQDCNIYAASVFLNDVWFVGDTPRLGHYARKHQMLVVMANHGKSEGTLESFGHSTIWRPGGSVCLQSPDTASCLLIAEQTNGKWIGRTVAL